MISGLVTNLTLNAAVNPDDVVNKLFPNIWLLIAHLIATFIIVTLMAYFLWKPVKRALQSRSDYIQKAINEAANERNLASKQNEKAEKELIDARLQAEEIVARAKLDAYRERTDILQNAKNQADKMQVDALDSIEKERQSIRLRLKSQITDVAMVAASKILEREVDSAINQKLVDKSIQEIEAEEFNREY